MRIFYSDSSKATEAKIILLWGAGLIGQSISEALLGKEKLLSEEHAFPWEDYAGQEKTVQTIRTALESRFLAATDRLSGRVVFVWSAGRAGFSARSEQTGQEMAVFMRVLEFARTLQQALNNVRVEFHLLSSAGGLFEGGRMIGPGELPAPRRPYGRLKLEQEQALLNAPGLVASIYRAASVYGVPSLGRRNSLIPVLLHHGLLRQVVSIVGEPTTLRDYVSVDDVGEYIARKILSPDLNKAFDGLYWMVTGKPSSILEMTRLVEGLIRHRLYLAYKFDPDNCCDITFSPQLKPVDFNPILPACGIALIYGHWQEFI